MDPGDGTSNNRATLITLVGSDPDHRSIFA